MIVMKFGGTSVESAEALARVAGIVRDRVHLKPVVVVSAMGKTTNKLLAMAHAAVTRDESYACQLEDLRQFHEEESKKAVSEEDYPEVKAILGHHFKELTRLLDGLSVLGELTPRSTDAIASYGERMSSVVATCAFRNHGVPATHMDSRKVVVTDNRFMQAVPIFYETGQRLQTQVKPLLEDGVVVMGGFIASTIEGVTTTLGRGGSDFSAAIIGAGLDADEIQIWTDVDGMMTTDPRLIPHARRLKKISFAEAAELAYFGAKVLHPATVIPAIEKGIPVTIKNSRRPEVAGTEIVAEAVPSTNVVKAIAFKRDITLVSVQSTRMLMAYGFLKRIFEIFERYETSVDVVATSEVSVSLTIDNPKNLDMIKEELRTFSQVDSEHDQVLVCIVGEGLRHTAGVAARAFGSLDRINVRLISQGSSLLNLSMVISEPDLQRAVECLHEEFFSEVDPEVFE